MIRAHPRRRASDSLPGRHPGPAPIDPGGSGARNFKSFAAAASALESAGISGPVRFVTPMTSHQETWKLGPVAGTSSTNTITFQAGPGGTKLTGTALDVVTLDHVPNVVFDGFEFTHATTSVSVSLIQLRTDGFEIRNCSLSATGGVLGIAGQGNGWRIHDNEFAGNGVEGGGVLPPCEVYRNRFVCNRSHDRSAVRVLGFVYNNLFVGEISNSSISAAAAIGPWNCDFWHNTISVKSSSWAIRAHAHSSPGPASTIFNNVIDVQGAGVGVSVYETSPATSFFTEFDNNLYSVASGHIGSFKGAVVTSLGAWQSAISSRGAKQHNDRSSRVGDPKFVSATDLRLRFGSAAVDGAALNPVSYIGSAPILEDADRFLRGNMHDIGAYELAGHRFFGSGCPGTGGQVPRLDVYGDVGPGKFTRFEVTRARPGAVAWFVLGQRQVSVPLGGTCTLWTDPLLLRPLSVSSAGIVSRTFQLPINQPVGGPDMFTQFGVVDPNAGGLGIAGTRAARIRL